MKAKRRTKLQIVEMPRTKERRRKPGTCEPTFQNWNAKYAGRTASAASRLKKLKAGNGELKCLLADAEPGLRIRLVFSVHMT
jgi:hypothetical protein